MLKCEKLIEKLIEVKLIFVKYQISQVKPKINPLQRDNPSQYSMAMQSGR